MENSAAVGAKQPVGGAGRRCVLVCLAKCVRVQKFRVLLELSCVGFLTVISAEYNSPLGGNRLECNGACADITKSLAWPVGVVVCFC